MSAHKSIRPWTRYERRKLKHLWREGMLGEDIAREMNRSYASVMGQLKWLRERGSPLGKRRDRGRIQRRSDMVVTASPLVCFVFAEMNRQFVTYDEIAKKAGVNRSAISKWARGREPLIGNLEAVLGALGYELAIQDADDGDLPNPLRLSA